MQCDIRNANVHPLRMLQVRWLAYTQRQLDKQNAAECGEAKAVDTCHCGKSCACGHLKIAVVKAQNGFTGSPLVWKHAT